MTCRDGDTGDEAVQHIELHITSDVIAHSKDSLRVRVQRKDNMSDPGALGARGMYSLAQNKIPNCQSDRRSRLLNGLRSTDSPAGTQTGHKVSKSRVEKIVEATISLESPSLPPSPQAPAHQRHTSSPPPVPLHHRYHCLLPSVASLIPPPISLPSAPLSLFVFISVCRFLRVPSSAAPTRDTPRRNRADESQKISRHRRNSSHPAP